MARQLHVYLDPIRMPDAAALQAALKSLGLGLKLDGAWEPYEMQGYLSVTADGEDAGAYVSFGRDAALPDSAAALAPQQAARRAVVRLGWGGDRREELAAYGLAAALTEHFDALVIEPERGLRKSLSSLKAHAREIHEGTF